MGARRLVLEIWAEEKPARTGDSTLLVLTRDCRDA